MSYSDVSVDNSRQLDTEMNKSDGVEERKGVWSTPTQKEPAKGARPLPSRPGSTSVRDVVSPTVPPGTVTTTTTHESKQLPSDGTSNNSEHIQTPGSNPSPMIQPEKWNSSSNRSTSRHGRTPSVIAESNISSANRYQDEDPESTTPNDYIQPSSTHKPTKPPLTSNFTDIGSKMSNDGVELEKNSVMETMSQSDQVKNNDIPKPSSDLAIPADEKAAKMMRLRQKAVEELVSTEKAYLGHLLRLVNLFIRPLRGASVESSPAFGVLLGSTIPGTSPPVENPPSELLSPWEQERIFHRLDDVLPLHKMLLEQICEVAEGRSPGWLQRHAGTPGVPGVPDTGIRAPRGWSDTAQIGPIFTKFAPFFKMYSAYCYGYSNAAEDLSGWLETRPALRAWVEKQQAREDCARQNLQSLLVMPIQRVPRYALLLGELRKNTPPSHPDFTDLSRSLELIQAAAAKLDSSVARFERQAKVVELQRRLSPTPEPSLVAPHREFQKEGTLSKVCRPFRLRPYQFFLFSDALVYASPDPGVLQEHRDRLKLHQVLSLVGVEPYTSAKSGMQHAFKILAHPKSIIVAAPSAAERDDWYNSIKQCVAGLQRARRSLGGDAAAQLRSMHVAAPTMALEEEQKQEKCAVCQQSFGVTRRRNVCVGCGHQVCGSCSESAARVADSPNIPANFLALPSMSSFHTNRDSMPLRSRVSTAGSVEELAPGSVSVDDTGSVRSQHTHGSYSTSGGTGGMLGRTAGVSRGDTRGSGGHPSASMSTKDLLATESAGNVLLGGVSALSAASTDSDEDYFGRDSGTSASAPARRDSIRGEAQRLLAIAAARRAERLCTACVSAIQAGLVDFQNSTLAQSNAIPVSETTSTVAPTPDTTAGATSTSVFSASPPRIVQIEIPLSTDTSGGSSSRQSLPIRTNQKETLPETSPLIAGPRTTDSFLSTRPKSVGSMPDSQHRPSVSGPIEPSELLAARSRLNSSAASMEHRRDSSSAGNNNNFSQVRSSPQKAPLDKRGHLSMLSGVSGVSYVSGVTGLTSDTDAEKSPSPSTRDTVSPISRNIASEKAEGKMKPPPPEAPPTLQSIQSAIDSIKRQKPEEPSPFTQKSATSVNKGFQQKELAGESKTSPGGSLLTANLSVAAAAAALGARTAAKSGFAPSTSEQQKNKPTIGAMLSSKTTPTGRDSANSVQKESAEDAAAALRKLMGDLTPTPKTVHSATSSTLSSDINPKYGSSNAATPMKASSSQSIQSTAAMNKNTLPKSNSADSTRTQSGPTVGGRYSSAVPLKSPTITFPPSPSVSADISNETGFHTNRNYPEIQRNEGSYHRGPDHGRSVSSSSSSGSVINVNNLKIPSSPAEKSYSASHASTNINSQGKMSDSADSVAAALRAQLEMEAALKSESQSSARNTQRTSTSSVGSGYNPSSMATSTSYGPGKSTRPMNSQPDNRYLGTNIGGSGSNVYKTGRSGMAMMEENRRINGPDGPSVRALAGAQLLYGGQHDSALGSHTYVTHSSADPTSELMAKSNAPNSSMSYDPNITSGTQGSRMNQYGPSQTTRYQQTQQSQSFGHSPNPMHTSMSMPSMQTPMSMPMSVPMPMPMHVQMSMPMTMPMTMTMPVQMPMHVPVQTVSMPMNMPMGMGMSGGNTPPIYQQQQYGMYGGSQVPMEHQGTYYRHQSAPPVSSNMNLNAPNQGDQTQDPFRGLSGR